MEQQLFLMERTAQVQFKFIYNIMGTLHMKNLLFKMEILLGA